MGWPIIQAGGLVPWLPTTALRKDIGRYSQKARNICEGDFFKAEQRSLENVSAPLSADDFLHIMGWGNYSSAAGITVNTDNALGVPAVWAAVNFVSGTLASLPLEVHRRTDVGFERVRDGVEAWLDRAVNPALSSFAWRKYILEQVPTGGRAVTLIMRNSWSQCLGGVAADPGRYR